MYREFNLTAQQCILTRVATTSGPILHFPNAIFEGRVEDGWLEGVGHPKPDPKIWHEEMQFGPGVVVSLDNIHC